MHNADKVLLGAALALASLTVTAVVHAQGGAPAPNFDEPCPALYPGDEAGKERIARWMARGAAERGLPPELPVMAGLAESGLRNLRGGSYQGFFGMHDSLNSGDYRGFPRNPDLQVKWFIDHARVVRQRRVAEGRPDPANDSADFGLWIADVERPAPENRSGYQVHLDEARDLIAGKCAPPAEDDTTPPILQARIAARQQPLGAGGIVISARCPDPDCLLGATATIGTRTVRTTASEPTIRGYTTLTAAVPRAARRHLRAGGTVRAKVTAIAADAAANTTTRQRLVTLVG
jgi:hypothetical protein